MVTSVEPTRISVGRFDKDFAPVLAAAARSMLAEECDETGSCLIAPTGAAPYPRVLVRRTAHPAIHCVDPNPDFIAAQRRQVGDQVIYHCVRLAELDDAVRECTRAVNPFGLQARPGTALIYADLVRDRLTDGGLLQTLDWGPTSYPDTIAMLPGISDEVAFSRSAAVPVFRDGWSLRREVVFDFELLHRRDEICELLSPLNADALRAVVPDPATDIVVGSAVIYRCYVAS